MAAFFLAKTRCFYIGTHEGSDARLVILIGRLSTGDLLYVCINNYSLNSLDYVCIMYFYIFHYGPSRIKAKCIWKIK